MLYDLIAGIISMIAKSLGVSYATANVAWSLYLQGRLFKIRIKIWYKKWCYIGVFKLLIFNTLIYKIVLWKFV